MKQMISLQLRNRKSTKSKFKDNPRMIPFAPTLTLTHLISENGWFQNFFGITFLLIFFKGKIFHTFPYHEPQTGHGPDLNWILIWS